VEEILKTALLGTAKNAAGVMTDHPADQITGKVATDSADRKLLLRAGTWATYQFAGHLPEQLADVPKAAPEENWPCCSARAANIMEEFLERKQPDLLAEAFELLAKAGQRLPPRILPSVLEYYSQALEASPDVLKVMGQRGLWLCQFNEKWRKFLNQSAEDSGRLPANAEALWNEGPPSERKRVLSKVRFLDPVRGRQWLESVWATEKADTRAELLEVLETGLSSTDQAFLEGALTDSSKRVRSTAARFLCRLPDSGTAQRTRRLGESMLAFSAPKSAGRVKSLVRSLTGKTDSGKLTINPPQEFDKQWEKDAVQEKPPPGMGKREFWLVQVMERIPPSHWDSYFQVPVGQLISAAAEDDFGTPLLKAWSMAAQYFRCNEWLAALWDYWFHWKEKRPKEQEIVHTRLTELLGPMQPAEREVRVLALVEKFVPEDSMLIYQTLEHMPRPWSERLARAFIASTRRMAAASPKESADLAAWSIILAIPPTCFSDALKPWDIPETDDYHVRACRKAIGVFTEITRLRRDFYEAVSSK
jgi:hypothetical protein